MSRIIQLMLVRQCKYLQITNYFNITTENISELHFRGILKEKKRIKFIRFLRQPNNSKSSPYFQV